MQNLFHTLATHLASAVADPVPQPEPGVVEILVENLAASVALAAEGAAILFIVIGIVQGVVTYVRKGIVGRKSHMALVEIRNELGHMLSLALEFLIGADILKTAISPTWEDIGQLAAVVAVRTVLNFFLVREIREFESLEPMGTGADRADS